MRGRRYVGHSTLRTPISAPTTRAHPPPPPATSSRRLASPAPSSSRGFRRSLEKKKSSSRGLYFFLQKNSRLHTQFLVVDEASNFYKIQGLIHIYFFKPPPPRAISQEYAYTHANNSQRASEQRLVVYAYLKSMHTHMQITRSK